MAHESVDRRISQCLSLRGERRKKGGGGTNELPSSLPPTRARAQSKLFVKETSGKNVADDLGGEGGRGGGGGGVIFYITGAPVSIGPFAGGSAAERVALERFWMAATPSATFTIACSHQQKKKLLTKLHSRFDGE